MAKFHYSIKELSNGHFNIIFSEPSSFADALVAIGDRGIFPVKISVHGDAPIVFNSQVELRHFINGFEFAMELYSDATFPS